MTNEEDNIEQCGVLTITGNGNAITQVLIRSGTFRNCRSANLMIEGNCFDLETCQQILDCMYLLQDVGVNEDTHDAALTIVADRNANIELLTKLGTLEKCKAAFLVIKRQIYDLKTELVDCLHRLQMVDQENSTEATLKESFVQERSSDIESLTVSNNSLKNQTDKLQSTEALTEDRMFSPKDNTTEEAVVDQKEVHTGQGYAADRNINELLVPEIEEGIHKHLESIGDSKESQKEPDKEEKSLARKLLQVFTPCRVIKEMVHNYRNDRKSN